MDILQEVKFGRNLTSFDWLDSLDYGYFTRGEVMKVNKCALVVIKVDWTLKICMS